MHRAGADAPPAVLWLRAPAELPAVRSGVSVLRLLQAALLLLVVQNLGHIAPALSGGVRSAPLQLNDLAVIGLVGVGALWMVYHRTVRLDGPALCALAFAAVGGSTALLAVSRFGLSPQELVFSLGFLVRWLVYFGVYVVARTAMCRHDVRPVWKALETAVLVFAAFGVVQSLFLPGFAQMVDPTPGAWDPQGRRLVSTMLDPNLAGAFLMPVLLVYLGQVAVRGRVPFWKITLLAAAVLLTVSRSTLAAVFVGGLVILPIVGLSRPLLRRGVVLGVLALPFVPALLVMAAGFNKLSTSDPNLYGRVETWLRALRVIHDFPVTGIGFNTYGYAQRAYGYEPGNRFSFSLDGGLLFVLVMTGVVGLALFLWMLVLIVRRCRASWREPDRPAGERGLAIGIAATTVAILVHSLFVNSLFTNFILEELWVLWALSGALREADAGARRWSVRLAAPVPA